ncbi:hypothetical protein PRZ48_011600 [Zasmidium cellare]|uniref:2EXR domain-containing protein n=1 Tax=Zasmidium cellare TaxID=395010 RepID=A0ABR0E6T4_ZASCE|nr:hypothetical protein PRZ48_011600 [Zasmidium cellare]
MKRTFLDLPPEIRNEIYLLALQHNRPLQVIRVWIKHQYTLKSDRSSCNTALLATCRTINKEATPVLYGSNSIVIGGASVPEFVAQIGASVKHLRQIEVSFHGTINILRSAMRALQPAGELEILKIGIFLFGDAKNAWSMARGLVPWVKAQCGRRRSSGAEQKDVRDVVKVLKFAGREFAEEGMGVVSVREEYEEEVRAKLVELMK